MGSTVKNSRNVISIILKKGTIIYVETSALHGVIWNKIPRKIIFASIVESIIVYEGETKDDKKSMRKKIRN